MHWSARLMVEREWPAQPSMRCNYCPYNGDACHAYAEMAFRTEAY